VQTEGETDYKWVRYGRNKFQPQFGSIWSILDRSNPQPDRRASQETHWIGLIHSGSVKSPSCGFSLTSWQLFIISERSTWSFSVFLNLFWSWIWGEYQSLGTHNRNISEYRQKNIKDLDDFLCYLFKLAFFAIFT
jgi:hypothetical protein